MKKYFPVIAAGVGGAFPGLLHLAMLCINSPDKLPAGGALGTFLLGVLLYAILGGFVGFIWGEVNLQKAFYIGVGLPALLNASIANVTSVKSEEHDADSSPTHTWTFPGLVTSALAQGSNEVGRANDGTVRSTSAQPSPPRPPIEVHGLEPVATKDRVLVIPPNTQLSRYELTVFADDGKRLSRYAVDPRKTNTFTMPESAKSFTIEGGEFSPVREELNSGPENLLEVKAERRTWSGFKRALGMQGVKDFSVDVRQKPIEKP